MRASSRCAEFKVTIPEVVPWLCAYYSLPDNGMGGVLHIVLEDDNTENHWETELTQSARERGDEFGEQLVHVLFSHMSRSQRHRLYRDYSFYPDGPTYYQHRKPWSDMPQSTGWEHVSYDGA